MIPRDARSSDHQYEPGFVGGVVVCCREACDGLALGVAVSVESLGRPWGGVKEGWR